ncbi:MAG: response regulator [Gammaproteobacteria bacterium]
MTQSTRTAILFVDDEPKALKYFRLAIEKDYPVLTAESVAEALEILEEQAHRIGVLISDQRMPVAAGVTLLKAARERYPAIVRMLTTAYSELDAAVDAVNSGEIHRYIPKPWDIERLRIELVQAMQLFELRQERDLLLAEKLNVLQRMDAADRCRDLRVAAAALHGFNHVDAAVMAFLDHHLERLAAAKADITALDLWTHTLDESDHSRTLVTSAVSAASEHRDSPAPWGEIARLAGTPAADDSHTPPLPLGTDKPADISDPAALGRLLGAYLLAWHHGCVIHMDTTMRLEKAEGAISTPDESDTIHLLGRLEDMLP